MFSQFLIYIMFLRLFLVYMLPHLRELDDRGVNELERGAALLHFSSDQSHNFSFNSPDENESSYEIISTTGPQTHPRVKMVHKTFPLTHSALDDDDVALLDLLSKSRLDAATPKVSSSKHVFVGNPFTEIEGKICSRLDVNPTLRQVFGKFVKEITKVIQCNLSGKERVGFVEDFNVVVENKFLEFSAKEEEISMKEKEWKSQRRSFEERLVAAEEVQKGCFYFLIQFTAHVTIA